MKKKVLPVIIVLLLIILVGAAGLGVHLIQKYTPTKEQMDAAAYYNVEDGESENIPLIFGTEILEEKGLMKDGEVFLSMDTVSSYLNKRFYWDSGQQQLLYTNPTEKYVFDLDSKDYTVGDAEKGSEDFTICTMAGDTLYINVKYVQKVTDIDYKLWENPNRLVVEYQWNDVKVVTVKKGDAAVRYRGGIKSEILTTVAKDTPLRLLKEYEEWDQVATEDGFIGFIDKKDLKDKVGTLDAQRTFQEPVYTNISRDHKINLAWHQVTSELANETFDSALKNTSGINVISPTWFSVSDNKGNITNFATEDYVTKAHQKNMEVWGLVDNFSENMNTFKVLSDTYSRTNLEENLVKQAMRFQLDGINVDFETLTEDTIPHFIQFLREMSILCRANNLVLSVDDPVPENYTTFYDRKSQGEVVDYIIIMGYDEHYKGSEEAGSVASLPWVEQGIKDTLSEVPANKVINGVPFYSRVWKTSAGVVTSDALGMADTKEYIKNHNIETYWSEDCGQNYGEYEDGSDRYQVWLEDEDSLAAKMELIKKYELAGVAEWKLGFEQSSVWDVISKGLQ